MFDTHVTVVGNLVAEPRLTFTKDDQPVASFRLASTPRRFDRATGEWKDGDTLFTNVTCWRALAENVSASLKKGASVIVLGRLSVRPYETKDGDKRQSVDIDAMAVGPDLTRVIALIKRAERAVPAALDALGVDESRSNDDFASSVGLPGELDPLGDPFALPRGGDSPEMAEDGTGPAIELMAALEGAADPDTVDAEDVAEPVPALAGTGGRWRSRSAG